MKKRTLCLIMTVFMLCLVLVRGGRGEDAAEGKGKIIAFFMPHLDTPFMHNLADAVKKYADVAGLKIIEYVCDNQPSKQVFQIQDAIILGVDGIVLDPSSNEGIAEGVRAAKAANIPVITLHESIATQNECVSFVGSDFTDGGMKGMKQAMADFPEGARFAIIYGALGHSAQIYISAGYSIALRGYEDKYKIVFEGEGGWSTEGALALAAKWFSSGMSLDAIVCNNDAMAIGALQAASAAGKAGKVKIYGLDAQDDVLGAIEEGIIRATIFIDYDTEAKVAIDAITKVMNGKFVKSRYLIPVTLITGENVKKFIKK